MAKETLLQKIAKYERGEMHLHEQKGFIRRMAESGMANHIGGPYPGLVDQFVKAKAISPPRMLRTYYGQP